MLLKVLTWNIEGRGLSAAAPNGYSAHRKQKAILRHITHHAPDIVALQEVFDLPFWSEALAQHRYKCVGGVYSHCGATTLFLGERCNCLKDDALGPSICAEVKVAGAGGPILVAGCHLQPFKEGAAQRLLQLQHIAQATASWPSSLSQPQQRPAAVPAPQAPPSRQPWRHRSRNSSSDRSCSSGSDGSEDSDRAGHRRKNVDNPRRHSRVPAAEQETTERSAPASLPVQLPVLIVGDMNMREAETAAVTDAADLGLSDAYLTATASGTAAANSKDTWDTRRNKYYDEGFKYACRYDRVFCKGDPSYPLALESAEATTVVREQHEASAAHWTVGPTAWSDQASKLFTMFHFQPCRNAHCCFVFKPFVCDNLSQQRSWGHHSYLLILATHPGWYLLCTGPTCAILRALLDCGWGIYKCAW